MLKLSVYLTSKRLRQLHINPILFTMAILLTLVLLHLFFFRLGQYEDMYKMKGILGMVLLIPIVVPKHVDKKIERTRAFFGTIEPSNIQRFYTTKNYAFVLLSFVMLFWPYHTMYVPLSLFYLSVVVGFITFSLLSVRFLPATMGPVFFKGIQISLAWCLFLFTDEILNYNPMRYVTRIPTVLFIIFLFCCIFLSVRLLEKYRVTRESSKYLPIFVRKRHQPFNYNVLYFLRSGVLFNAIITFYITQLILLGGEDLSNRLFSIGFVIAVHSLYFLYTLWNLEKERVLSFYDQQHRQTVYNEKIKAFYIILILYMLCILPYLTITLGLRRAAVLFMLQLIPAVTIAGVLFYKNRKNDFRLEKKNYILFLLLFLVSIIVSISMM